VGGQARWETRARNMLFNAVVGSSQTKCYIDWAQRPGGRPVPDLSQGLTASLADRYRIEREVGPLAYCTDVH